MAGTAAADMAGEGGRTQIFDLEIQHEEGHLKTKLY